MEADVLNMVLDVALYSLTAVPGVGWVDATDILRGIGRNANGKRDGFAAELH